MALADQRVLYSRLKMKPLYPELMEPEEEGAGGGGTKEGGVEPTTVTDGDAVATKQAAVGGEGRPHVDDECGTSSPDLVGNWGIKGRPELSYCMNNQSKEIQL